MNKASQALFSNGSLALKQARYDEAIACLEQFCKETADRRSKQFFQAQMWLIEAYHKAQQDLHAIALCEQLAKSDIPQVQRWANNALSKLMSTSSSKAASETPSPVAAAPVSDLTGIRSAVVKSPPAKMGPSLPLPVTQTTPQPTTYRSAPIAPRRPAPSSKKDYTGQIVSAVAHGSISVLASILLFVLFADSLVANGMGIVRFIVPLMIFLTTQESSAKENAREALNYILTCLILVIPIYFAAFLLLFIFMAFFPLAILLGLVLGGYLMALSIYPVVATFACMTNKNCVFRYPNWLIFHLV